MTWLAYGKRPPNYPIKYLLSVPKHLYVLYSCIASGEKGHNQSKHIKEMPKPLTEFEQYKQQYKVDTPSAMTYS